MRIGWLTDIHLNFVSSRERGEFYRGLREQSLDALLIGGDIGEADSVTRLLDEFTSALAIPIYFVLGNHDFYRSSIASVREKVARHCANSPNLHWLTESGVMPLSDGTALIGHDSWADGRFGDFFGSDVMLNDYRLIEELSGLSQPQLLDTLHALGDEAAQLLEDRARQALAGWREVVVLTHVPPFREACWHEGRISGDDYLPHFACRSVGERLARLMREHTGNGMTILCGHTHSSGEAHILDNLTVLTGAAEYGRPVLQRIFELA